MSFARPKAVSPQTPLTVPTRFTGRRWHAIQILPWLLRSSHARLFRHWFLAPLTPRELGEVKSIIDRALVVAPDSSEARFALGLFFYWGHRQYENALAEFNRARELQPNNALARESCAYVYRRRGEWERSLAEFQRAQELNPRDAGIPGGIGSTYEALRLWKDAERAELRALAIDPHNTVAALDLLLTMIRRKFVKHDELFFVSASEIRSTRVYLCAGGLRKRAFLRNKIGNSRLNLLGSNCEHSPVRRGGYWRPC